MILFISHYAGRTGAPIALLQLLRWIRSNTDLQFHILLKHGGELADDFRAIAPTFVCESPRYRSFFKHKLSHGYPLRLPPPVISQRYSLIYSNTVANGLLVASLFDKAIPLVTHCHEMDYWMRKLAHDEMPATIDRTNEFIACSTSSSKCLVKRGVPEDRIHVIPEPCSFSHDSHPDSSSAHLRQLLGIPRDSFVVLSGGAESWRKGKDLFAQLAVLLNTSSSQRYDLIWLGSRSDAEFEYWLDASAEYAGVSQYLHSPGQVGDPQPYFAISNAFGMLSREDPMPLIAIEAGASGLPVICFSRAGGTSDWVADSGGGLVVPYLDVSRVARAIRDYSNNLQQCIADGALAREYCLSNFSSEAVGTSVLNVLAKYLSAQ